MQKILATLVINMVRIGATRAQSLFDVSLDYCEVMGNTLALQVDVGVPQNICYTLANHANTPITIAVSFVDGIYTNDTLHNKACLSANDVQQFGIYVSGYDAQITLQPGEIIQKQAVLQYPIESNAGTYHGCIVYTVPPQKLVADQNINVLMRKAKFIDVTLQSSGQTLGYTRSDTPQKIQRYIKEVWPRITSDVDKEKSIIIDTMSYMSILIFVMVCVVVGWYITNKKKNHTPQAKSFPSKAKK